MTETNNCVEKDALIDYLYGEVDRDARTRVEAHLRTCARCADEARGLKGVRSTLEVWAPPEAELGFRVVSDAHPEHAPVSFWGRLRHPPAWGFATAAIVVLAVAAGVAKPELAIGRGEMVLRIGWRETGSAGATQPDAAPASQSDSALVRVDPRQEIEALRGTPVAAGPRARDIPPVRGGADVSREAGAVAAADERLLRGVRQLLREEERIANQRQADLSELQRAFGEFEVTGAELARQQLIDVLSRVSAQ